MTSIVLSSKALPLLEVVGWCLLIAPLCWGERGAGKWKAFKWGSAFSLTEVLCCVTDKSQTYIYIHTH